MNKRIITVITACSLLFLTNGAFALTFNFTPGAGMSTTAINGFNAAGTMFSSRFTDAVSVNINIDFTSLGSGILGSTGSTKTNYNYSSVYTALNADKTSSSDITAVSNLNPGSSFDLLMNRTSNNPNGAGSAIPYLDNDGGANNSTIRMTTANAKAIGLLSANAAGVDANISFNSQFSWDFDPSDGITAGAFDFVGVAMHEIGHSLGFISGVDVLDINSTSSFFPDNAFTFVNILDLFRFSNESVALNANDWTARDAGQFFSIDGGSSNLAGFATGKIWGDGRQASHWKDGLGLGLMDPTLAGGELLSLSALDLKGFDVIGWTVIPEPATVVLFSLGLFGLVGVSRKVKRV